MTHNAALTMEPQLKEFVLLFFMGRARFYTSKKMDHGMTIQEPVERTEVKQTPQGLTSAQVIESRAKHGNNVLTPPKEIPWWKLYLEKFEDPIIRILLIAAGITLIVGFVDGHFAEGIGIIIAILLATSLAFVNEFRAKREFDVLNQVNDDMPINVIRDGAYMMVPRRDLVVGDYVLLEAGSEVPADGVLREAFGVQVNEALLTGESLPVIKTFVRNNTPHEENSLYRSTLIADGRGTMEVTAVGDFTKIGEIAREATETTDEVTPLNYQLERLSKLIGVVGFSVAALTYVALVVRASSVGELVLSSNNWLFVILASIVGLTALARIWLPIVYDAFEIAGRPRKPMAWMEDNGIGGWLKPLGIGAAILVVGLLVGIATATFSSDPSQWLPSEAGILLLRFFMVAVTIIVVAVPEGLPMSVTLSLAYSMRKMTATNNLVRRMHATETVGASTVICSDKTGTLTLNQMRLYKAVFPALGNRLMNKDMETEIERWVAEAFANNTTANLSRITGEPIKVLGDGTEGALLMWLEELGIDYLVPRNSAPIIAQLQFSAERKYMATVSRSSVTGTPVMHVKGAPEIILDHCSQVLTNNGYVPVSEMREQIEEDLLNLQRRGMRTLGFAMRPIDPSLAHIEMDIEAEVDNLVWLGYVAISDPIRPEVPGAVDACRNAGIHVKVVTGDTEETAKEIARQIHLWDAADDDDPQAHMSGAEFEALSDEEVLEAVKHLKVLSRAKPLDKMRLVTSLQKNGEVVAVTGDGTNDAPALNYANVGLAMGSGTDIAKEAADIILLDDSFRSIVNAVMWGRSLYQNIQRFILFQLTINVAALGISLLGPFIGVEFPLTVIQMLWINLIMDTFASLALASEPAHWEVMRQLPRRTSDFIINLPMARRILGTGLTFVVFLIGFLFVINGDGQTTEKELSIFYATFIMLQFWNLFNARTLGSSTSAFTGLRANPTFTVIAVVIFIGTVLIVTFGGDIFRTVPLSITEWLIITAGTSLVLFAGEGLRFLERRNQAETTLEAQGIGI